VKLAVSQGNEIASHTWNHPDLEKASESKIRKQLEDTNNIVAEVTGGYQVKVLRPPYGNVNKRVRTICADMDMIIAHWELDTLDWATRNPNKTYNKIMKDVDNGMIILCHDIYETTAEAAERAIPELVAQGYQLVTVSELFSFHKDGVKPGTVYSHLDPKNIKMD
ncbi:MAG: polysaccharide deacetylase family protein, partial [Clostridia bacterium]|nr:polysaccharide deacetylase family protein [Clostridia bacterium]